MNKREKFFLCLNENYLIWWPTKHWIDGYKTSQEIFRIVSPFSSQCLHWILNQFTRVDKHLKTKARWEFDMEKVFLCLNFRSFRTFTLLAQKVLCLSLIHVSRFQFNTNFCCFESYNFLNFSESQSTRKDSNKMLRMFF